MFPLSFVSSFHPLSVSGRLASRFSVVSLVYSKAATAATRVKPRSKSNQAMELTASRRTTLVFHDFNPFTRCHARSRSAAAHLVLVRRSAIRPVKRTLIKILHQLRRSARSPRDSDIGDPDIRLLPRSDEWQWQIIPRRAGSRRNALATLTFSLRACLLGIKVSSERSALIRQHLDAAGFGQWRQVQISALPMAHLRISRSFTADRRISSRGLNCLSTEAGSFRSYAGAPTSLQRGKPFAIAVSKSSNQAMEPTTGRRTPKFSMTRTSHPAATRALASGGSSCSR